METKHILGGYSNCKIKLLKQVQVPKIKEAVNSPVIREEWLDGVSIQTIFKISRTTLYRMRKAQLVPYTRLKGKYLYPKNYFHDSLLKKAMAMVK